MHSMHPHVRARVTTQSQQASTNQRSGQCVYTRPRTQTHLIVCDDLNLVVLQNCDARVRRPADTYGVRKRQTLAACASVECARIASQAEVLTLGLEGHLARPMLMSITTSFSLQPTCRTKREEYTQGGIATQKGRVEWTWGGSAEPTPTPHV